MNNSDAGGKKSSTPENEAIEKRPKSDLPKQESPPLSLPEEFLKNIPPAQQEQIKGIFQQSLSVIGAPFVNPLVQKITPEHITAVIRNADESDKRDRDERKDERKHDFKILCTVLVVILILVGFLVLYNQMELLKYIISGIIGFGGGFGAGKYYHKED